MKEFQHTPAPWFVQNNGYDATVVTETLEVIAHVVSNVAQSELNRDFSDARLIAAAPDLLAACEASLSCMEALFEPTEGGVMSIVRAAISKANKCKSPTASQPITAADR